MVTPVALSLNFLNQKNCRDVAQLGSALAWGARGRRFKSSRPDQSFFLATSFFGLAKKEVEEQHGR